MVSENFNLATLRAIPMFSALKDEELNILRAGLSVATVSVGETIMTEAAAGGMLYVLLSGQVKVVAAHRTPDERVLNVLEPIEVFGEMSLLTDGPCSATVVATDFCHLLTLTRESLKTTLVQNPSVCFSLLRDAFNRIRNLTEKLSS